MRSGHNVTKKNGRSMGIKRLCWSLMLNRFIVAILIIFILVLIFVIKIVFIGTTGDLSQQEIDRARLKELNPFKNIDEIKAIARRWYQPRRSILNRVCDNIKDDRVLDSLTPAKGKWQSYIWYNFDRKYSFCGVAKVASSTWRSHNRDLVGAERFDAYLKELTRQNIGHLWYSKVSYHFYPLPENMTIPEAASELLTMVFVRHPFARFVSSYQDKIFNGRLSKLNRYIINKYRTRTKDMRPNDKIAKKHGLLGHEEEDRDRPTPLEFSLYVLDEAAKDGIENLNPHWQSQWGCCPFCTLDFDIVGHLETFAEDMDFIVEAMKWHGVLQDRHENRALSTDNASERKMRQFFSQLPKNVTWQLFKLYELDFLMFGYGGPEQWYAMGY